MPPMLLVLEKIFYLLGLWLLLKYFVFAWFDPLVVKIILFLELVDRIKKIMNLMHLTHWVVTCWQDY